jgi:hypothetical protein
MINKLEKLARAATPGVYHDGIGYDTYIAAANPAVVLKLCEVIRAQHAVLKDLEEIYGFGWRVECTARAVLAKANELGVSDE